MTWLALLEGVRGILYQPTLEKEWDLAQNEELWNQIKVLAQEIRSFERVLIRGTLRRADPPGIDDVFASTILCDKLYVIVANTSTDKRRISIPLHLKVESKGVPQLRTPPGILAVTREGLTGEVPPLEVLILRYEVMR